MDASRMSVYRSNVNPRGHGDSPEWIDEWYAKLCDEVKRLEEQKIERELDEFIELSDWKFALMPWYQRFFADEGLVRHCRATVRFYEERREKKR